MVAGKSGQGLTYRKTQAGQQFKQTFGSLEKPKKQETLTDDLRKMLPDIIAGSVFLPEEAGLIGSTAVGARVGARVGGKAGVKAIERQALRQGLKSSLRAESKAMKTSLGKDPQRLKFIANESLKLRNQADVKYTRLNEKVRSYGRGKVVPEDLEMELEKAKEEVELYGDQYSKARQRINELVETRADPKQIADEVIPTEPQNKLDELVEEQADIENIFKEVFKEGEEEPLLSKELENTNDINYYNSVIKTKHPTLKTYSEVENYNLFNKRFSRNPNNYDEFMNYIKYRDNELLYSATGVTTRLAKQLIESTKQETSEIKQETKQQEPLVRRRTVEGELGDFEEPEEKEGGDMGVFTDEPMVEGEPETQPTVDTQSTSDNQSSQTSTHSKFDIKDTITTFNIHEVFQDTIQLCKDSYDVDVNYQVDKYLVMGDFPVLFHKSVDTLYVVFRGTRNDFSTFLSSVESIRNMIIDVSTADFIGEDTALGEYPIFNNSLPKDMSSLTAHKGFIEELAEYYQPLREEISKYYGFVNHIVFSGHSAGGALATLCYYVYENDFTVEKERIKVEFCITYGSPRVIRDSFGNINLFNLKCKHYIRCFNANDIISYLPLKEKTSWGGSIASGFVHVGKPFPMDTNVENNSLNGLILQVLRGNYNKFDEIFKNYNLNEIRENEIIKLITSDKYLSIIGESLFQCYETVAVKPDVSDEMLLAQTGMLVSQSQKILDYALKCNLAEPLGVEEILKANNIYDSEIQEDIGITGVMGCLMGYNRLSVKGHDLNTYEENSIKLKRREIDRGISYLQPITPELDTYPLPPKPVPVSTTKIYIDLINEMVKDIESGKIVGAVQVNEEELPAIIEY